MQVDEQEFQRELELLRKNGLKDNTLLRRCCRSIFIMLRQRSTATLLDLPLRICARRKAMGR